MNAAFDYPFEDRRRHYRRDLIIEIAGAAAVGAVTAALVLVGVLASMHDLHRPWAPWVIAGGVVLTIASDLAGDRHFVHLLRRWWKR